VNYSKKIFISLLLLFSIIVSKTYAQESKYNIVNMSMKNGLSQNNVISLFQDKNNFLWIGTNEGLNKDNSYSFTNFFKKNNANSLSNNTIWSINEDKFGNILVGTREGLNIYNPVTEKFKVYKNDENNEHSLSHNNIRSIATFDSVNYWIGTNHGLNKIDIQTGKTKRFFHNNNDKNSISNNTVVSLFADIEENILWVGTRNGLNKYNLKTNIVECFFYSKQKTNTISGNNIRSIIKDSKGVIWVATENGISSLKKDISSNYNISSFSKINDDITLKDVSIIEEINDNNLFISFWKKQCLEILKILELHFIIKKVFFG